MEDFVNAIALEVKMEIANRYFGFRTRIEAEIHDYIERLQTFQSEISSSIRLDILRLRFLLHQERLFKDFLILARLPEKYADDESGSRLSPGPTDLFAEIKGDGLTRWRRYRCLTFKIYQSLADDINLYRQKYNDFHDEHEEICKQINDFHRNNDLSGILGFLQKFDSADIERSHFLQSTPLPNRTLDQDLKIALPQAVDTLLPPLAEVPPLKQVKKPLTALLRSAFSSHGSSRREASPF